MALTLTVQPQNVDASGHQVYVVGTIALSGSYPSGGETLDLTQIANAVPSASQPVLVSVESQNGNGGYYIPQQGSALNNWKLRVFQAGGTELAAGAYPAAFTSDVIAFSATYPKLR
jgi:hypothetical protein